MNSLKIDLWTDIVCPWCLIGQHRLDKVLAEKFPTLVADIEHHPFELHPTAPKEGLRTEDYRRSRGLTDPEQVRKIYNMIEGEARLSGLDLKLGQPYIYRTVHAHTLMRYARRHNRQHEFSMVLMKAFFFDSLNISDKNVLLRIAGKRGLNSTEVQEMLNSEAEQVNTERLIELSRMKGVRAVPFFSLNGSIVSGGSEIQIANAIERAIGRSRT